MGSGGTSDRPAAIAFSFLSGTGLPCSPKGRSQTTPRRVWGPNGTRTKAPGDASSPEGSR